MSVSMFVYLFVCWFPNSFVRAEILRDDSPWGAYVFRLNNFPIQPIINWKTKKEKEMLNTLTTIRHINTKTYNNFEVAQLLKSS